MSRFAVIARDPTVDLCGTESDFYGSEVVEATSADDALQSSELGRLPGLAFVAVPVSDKAPLGRHDDPEVWKL